MCVQGTHAKQHVRGCNGYAGSFLCAQNLKSEDVWNRLEK